MDTALLEPKRKAASGVDWASPVAELPPAWRGGIATAILSGIMLFVGLDYPLLEPDEGRYAAIPLLMLRSGDWIVPQVQGMPGQLKPYNDKPPLTYWLIALSYRVFGVHEWSARIVPAGAAWLCVLTIYVWGCGCLGWRVALLSTGVLSTMAGFVVMGRMLLLDGVLTLWVVLSLALGHTAVMRPRLRWGWWIASAVSGGLGILTKGPVALVLVVPCLAAYRWLDPRSARWRVGHFVAYGLVALAIAAPWYVAVWQRSENFAGEFFWRHHLMRFLSPYHHLRPWWFYLPVGLVELLPWTWAVLPWRKYTAGTSLAARWSALPGPVQLCAFAAAWCLLFFSISKCKLPTYLMPMLPPTALFVGWCVHETRRYRSWLVCGIVGIVVSALGIGGALSIYSARSSFGLPAARLAMAADADGIPSAAYRDDWESAVFYRGERELPVFSDREQSELIEWLRQRKRTLILLRDGKHNRQDELRLDELRRLLPRDLVVEGVQQDHAVIGVQVRRQDG